MSALQSALAELRACADTGSSAGLLADECAALIAHIDQLTDAASATEFGVRHRDGSVSSFVDGRLARIVSHEPGLSLVKRMVGPWEDADESEISECKTPAETRTCTGCDGTGERRDFNTDGEFESVERCGGCDGTGRVAIEAESGAVR